MTRQIFEPQHEELWGCTRRFIERELMSQPDKWEAERLGPGLGWQP